METPTLQLNETLHCERIHYKFTMNFYDDFFQLVFRSNSFCLKMFDCCFMNNVFFRVSNRDACVLYDTFIWFHIFIFLINFPFFLFLSPRHRSFSTIHNYEFTQGVADPTEILAGR